MLDLFQIFRWYHIPIGFILSILAIFTVAIVYRLILEPKMRRKHFQKQGIKIIKVAGWDVQGSYERSLIETGDALSSIRKEMTENPNTKMFAFEIGPLIALSLSDPAYIKEFLTLDYTHYTKVRFIDLFKLIFGKSLIAQYGDEWKVLRKLSSKAFQFDVLAANLGRIEETADWLCDKAQNGNLEKFKALDEFQMGTGEVVGKTFFGENLSNYNIGGKSLCLALSDLVAELTKNTMNMLYFLFGMPLVNLRILPAHRRVFRNINRFKAVCQQIIDKQKASGKKTEGFLQTFFDAQNDPQYSKYITDEVIIHQFIVMFIGGTDTTSHTLALAMYFLQNHPEMRTKMEKELNDVWPSGTPVDMTKLNKLEYMHSFLKETLRFGPPLTTMMHREAIKNHKILDIDIAKGTYLSLHYIAPHMNPKYYKNPEQFNPERFYEKDPEEGFHKEPFAFMGFSTGPRNCIGQHLAMLKAKIFLAKMVRRFEFKVPASYKFQMTQHEFYETRDPLVFHLTPKSK